MCRVVVNNCAVLDFLILGDSNFPCNYAPWEHDKHKLAHKPGLLWGASLLDPRAPQKRQEWPWWEAFCKGIKMNQESDSRATRALCDGMPLGACHWLPLEKAFMARTKSGSSSSVPIHLILQAMRCFQTNSGWHDKHSKSQGPAICIQIFMQETFRN